jgi:penicillin-binding protein 2
MYDKRAKIFIAISLALLLACVVRMAQMQLFVDADVQNEIAQLKRQMGQSKQLKTVRGRILDRRGNVLAADMPRFRVCIKYALSSLLDDRVVRARLEAAREKDPNPSQYKLLSELEARRNQINEVIIPGCVKFGLSEQQVRDRIQAINDDMWNLRAFFAWRRSSPDPNLLRKYNNRFISVPTSEAMADLARQIPDPDQRLRRIARVDDLREMDEPEPLFELKTDDDIFAAQIEFMNIADVNILPAGYRYYPYGAVASQTIGWVGPVSQDRDKKLFENDRLASYRQDELCGREDGVEYVCESILRGRRGEMVYDIDRELVQQTDTDFGDDVILTLDMDLQQRIEQDLTNPEMNPLYHAAGMAAVVIDVGSGDILALVSLPTYDLNTARYNYGDLLKDPNAVIHRAINKQYPPGSSVKPIILIAAMETGHITADEPIPCPAAKAPPGWPSCWIWRGSHRGHSDEWTNNARNALKGSCNIYFSHVADRLDPLVLQRWLFWFGYGRPIPLECPRSGPHPSTEPTAEEPNAAQTDDPGSMGAARQLRQALGQISTVPAGKSIQSFDDIPPLREIDRRLVGIGQGELRATPLQVANAFATIARGGLHKMPRLFLQPQSSSSSGPTLAADISISQHTLEIVREGMSAVVNERGGTAYDAFAQANLARYGVHVFGKTGSTEDPEDAWFSGFAEDTRGRKIAVAIVVEGGVSGSHDAAPLARHIIERCIETNHLGQKTPRTQ